MDLLRTPLQDIAINSPSIKRQKLNDSTAQETLLQHETISVKEVTENFYQQKHEVHAQKPLALNTVTEKETLQSKDIQSKSKNTQDTQQEVEFRRRETQLEAIPLPEWQRKWRRIMRDSVIYFDSNDLSVNEGAKRKEKEKAIKMFTQVGATIQPFFDKNVSIFISNRSRSELPKNIQTQQQSHHAPHPLKFWNYEKVFRFLKHLGEVPSPDKPQQPHQLKRLSTLLQDEKLHGTNDRDPNAKRDDFIYFKNPFFFVYDLRQIIKPVANREWKVKDSGEKSWPHLHESTYGHSLFQPDPSNIQDPRKIERRRLRDIQNREYREQLKLVYSKNPPTFGSYYTDDENSVDMENTSYVEFDEDEPDVDGHTTEMPPPYSNSKVSLSTNVPSQLENTNSTLANKFIESKRRDNFEIEASGYTGSGNNGNSQSNEFSKNGLVATSSTIRSKEVNSLQKRLIEKKSKMTAREKQQLNNKEKVAGYCENCRIHFEDFDEHSQCSQHRAFALDDTNFYEIDVLITKLQENIYNRRI